MANGLLLRLRERELSASPAERNVIAYVSAHPHEVVGLSVRGLADVTFSSPSSILRFCKRLGFAGYKEFQRERSITPSWSDARPVLSGHARSICSVLVPLVWSRTTWRKSSCVSTKSAICTTTGMISSYVPRTCMRAIWQSPLATRA